VVDQDSFLNMALAVEYYGTPQRLLSATQQIENVLGRKRTKHWGPRTIDIDIMLYDSIVMDTDQLTIPHSMMHERNFVLFPMAELDPHLVHPVLQKSMQQLLDESTDQSFVTVVNPEYV